jgi:hypothetical protein
VQVIQFNKSFNRNFSIRQVPGSSGKVRIMRIIHELIFNMIYLQSSILNHHTFQFSSSAALPVPVVFPLHTVTDCAGTDIPLTNELDLFLLYDNLKPYKSTRVQQPFLFHT